MQSWAEVNALMQNEDTEFTPILDLRVENTP